MRSRTPRRPLIAAVLSLALLAAACGDAGERAAGIGQVSAAPETPVSSRSLSIYDEAYRRVTPPSNPQWKSTTTSR